MSSSEILSTVKSLRGGRRTLNVLLSLCPAARAYVHATLLLGHHLQKCEACVSITYLHLTLTNADRFVSCWY